jgi:uncharacterized protein with FMN-binding domain
MRRVTLWAVGTATVLMLLFSYRTSTGGTVGSRPTAIAPPTGGGSTSAPATGGGSTSAGTSAAPSRAPGTSGSFTGDSVDTRWGPVQVKVTVESARITDVEAVVYPQENPRDQEINAYALPALHDEVLQAQSAKIDAVGGATVTSDGYIASLQSALDAAHLGS